MLVRRAPALSAVLLASLACACKGTAPQSRVLEGETAPAGAPSAGAAAAPKDRAGIEVLFGMMPQKPRLYPDLIAQLKKLTGAKTVELLVPKGRSLQKDKVNFTEPRIVVAFHDQPRPKWPVPEVADRLYVGFSAVAKQAEVISWNADLKRFDFFLLTDFGDPQKEPKLVREDRAKCTPCHQHEGPIFTPANWPETNVVNGYTKQKLFEHHADGKYWYVPIDTDPSNGGIFERSVENAAYTVGFRGLCRDFVCKDDADCRYDYVRSVLLVRDDWSRDDKFKELVDLKATGRKILDRWPRDKTPQVVSPKLDISVNDGISNDFPVALATQNPVKESDVVKTLGLDPKKPRGPMLLKMVSDNELADPNEANADAVGYKLIGQGSGMACLGLNGFDDNVLDAYPLDKLATALATPEFKTFVTSNPTAEAAPIMRQALLALGVPEQDIPSQYYVTSLGGGGGGDAPPPSYDDAAPAALLDHFCSPCHRGEASTGGALPLDDLAKMKTYKSPSYGSSVKEILQQKIMPPLSQASLKKIGWTTTVRQKLIDAL